MKAFDLHAHFTIPEYTDALKDHGLLASDGFPYPSWDLRSQLSAMDSLNIGKAVLSVSSPHPWFGDVQEASFLARALNEKASGYRHAYPERFLFAASLPLPDLDASVEELGYAFDHLQADAVKLPTNAGGIYPGSPALDPLFEKLSSRKAIVLLHPCAPNTQAPDCYAGRVLPLMEFLAETTRCVTELLVSGTIEKYPDIRFIVPHCGAFLPVIASRIEGMTAALAASGRGHAVRTGLLHSLYYDIAGDALPSGLDFLKTLTDDSHILYGSDYPFTPLPMVSQKKAALEKNLPAPLLKKIFRENAEALFRV